MALTEVQKKKLEEEENYRQQLRTANTPTKENHGVPAILSLFIPGLGQLVKGQIGKGIIIFFATIIGYTLVIPGLLIHIWQIVDAYNN